MRNLVGLFLVVLACFFYSPSKAQTTINLGDDAWRAIDLGFELNYFGQTFDSITIYNNGMAKFGVNGQYVPNCCQGYVPTEDYHDYGLFPLWTDLVGGSISYETDNIDSFWVRWNNQFEYYNQSTNNTFGIDIKSGSDGALIDFFYDSIDIRNHDVWSGLTGDVSEGEVIENFFHTHRDGVLTGGSEFDFSWSQTGYINCSNPLNDPSCKGYEEAYFEQQCSSNVLYDSQCPGYEQAYFEQQCSYDALYDSGCFGYEEAYYTQQCSLDSLYDSGCDGYVIAFEAQQCSLDPQYSPTCPGYMFPTVVVASEPEPSQNTGQPTIEESMGIPEETTEVMPEIVEIEEQIDVVVEEEVEEIIELQIITEEAIREEEQRPEQRSSSRRNNNAISDSLQQTASLLDNIIGNSITSGIEESNMTGSDGGFYDNGSSGIESISSSGQDFSEFVNTSTTESQDSQNLNDSIALGGSINTGISINSNENTQDEKENKEPSLAERMAEKQRKKNLDNQGGIFNSQMTALENLANGNNLDKYYTEQISDASSFYYDREIYEGNKLRDKAASLWRMQSADYGLMKEMIRSQY